MAKRKKKTRLNKNGIVLLSAIGVICFLIVCLFVLKKDLSYGDNKLEDGKIIDVINYNSDYDINELTIKYGNKLLGYKLVTDYKVIDSKSIDTTKLGDYPVTYEVKAGGRKYKVTKIVRVSDTEKPVIDTKDVTEYFACPKDKGNNDLEVKIEYTSNDNYDGDLTKSVVQKVDNGKIVLTSTDSHKNTATKNINIRYEDTTKPVIKLKGSSSDIAYIGTKYVDSGVTATDNCDDVSNKVKVEGSVDTSKEGDYTIKYTVTDDSGNESSVTRKVTVLKKGVILGNNNNGRKVIYLTFDDGPGPYTAKLLDILKKHDVKATFFVTNQYPAYQNLMAREAKEGHTVAVHSYSHDYSKIYKSVDAFMKDLNKMNEIIKKQTGSYSKLLRFPGGSSNDVSKKYSLGVMTRIVQRVNNDGFIYFDWNVTSGDAGETKSTSKVVSNVTSQMKSGRTLVVLQHDIKLFSVNAVEDIIKKGKEYGYTFEAMDSNSFTAHHSLNN